MAIPVGYAVGYIFGGVVGSWLGWRAAFLLEATLMSPFVVFALATPPVPLGVKAGRSRSGEAVGDATPLSDAPDESSAAPHGLVAPSELLTDLRTLAR